MTRSILKGPYCEIRKTPPGSKIWSRRSTILPEFIGKQFQIYNGKTFIRLTVSEEMIGHKFGEFSSTRKKQSYKKKKK